MLQYRCDNPLCKTTCRPEDIKSKFKIIDIGGKTYDMCNACATHIKLMLEDGFDLDIIDGAVEEIKEKKKERVKRSNKEFKADIIKKTYTRDELIKIVRDHRVDEISEKLNINRNTVYRELSRMGLSYRNVRKKTESDLEKTKVKKVEYKFEFRKEPIPEDYKHLKELEEDTIKPNIDCWNCAYRNQVNSRCWYTMVSNNKSEMTQKLCKHFVDRRKPLNEQI